MVTPVLLVAKYLSRVLGRKSSRRSLLRLRASFDHAPARARMLFCTGTSVERYSNGKALQGRGLETGGGKQGGQRLSLAMLWRDVPSHFM